MWVAGAQNLEQSSMALLRKRDQKWCSQDTNLHHIGCGCHRFTLLALFYSLTGCSTTRAPVFVFLCLAYFAQNNTLQVHPCCYTWWNCLLFLRLKAAHFAYTPQLFCIIIINGELHFSISWLL